MLGGDVGVADQRHVLDGLDTHDADHDAIGFDAGEPDAVADLVLQLFTQHVGFFPAVGWSDATGCLGGVVDDREHPIRSDGKFLLVISARASITRVETPLQNALL